METNTDYPIPSKFPEKLFRGFDKAEHRDAFLSGRIRMGGINGYRATEDKHRRDISEGKAVYRFPDSVGTIHFIKDSDETYSTEEPGLMETTATLSNPAYLLCTSTENVFLSYPRSKFGNYLVEINNPWALACDLFNYFKGSGHRIEGANVEYTKGEVIASQLAINESNRLSYIQKPACFIDECEFRYIAVFHRTAKQQSYIEIDLGKRLSYARAMM